MYRRLMLTLAAAALLAAPLQAGAQAQPDPLAALDASQRRALQGFLKKRSEPGHGDAQADKALLADLDGDGQPELVLLWTFMGPTFALSQVALFTGGAGGWRERASADIVGQAQSMAIERGEIRIATLRLGPRDARCCPSVKSLQRLRWVGSKLASNRI